MPKPVDSPGAAEAAQVRPHRPSGLSLRAARIAASLAADVFATSDDGMRVVAYWQAEVARLEALEAVRG